MAKYAEVEYEWDCETVATATTEDNERGEVLDHNHGDSLAEVAAYAASDPAASAICLVRDSYRDRDLGRSWAYLRPDGTLPEWFTDAMGDEVAKVPQRFHREAERMRGKLPAGLYPVEGL